MYVFHAGSSITFCLVYRYCAVDFSRLNRLVFCFRFKMNHCAHLFLLLAASLIALALLGVAFGTHWWTIALEKVIF